MLLSSFDDDIDQRLNFALTVVEMMRHVGEARAAIASFKHHRVGPEHRPDAAYGEVHVLDRPAWMRGKGAGQRHRRDGIAQEFHFAAGERRSEVIAPCATDRIDDFGTLGRADDVEASAWARCAIEELRHGHAQRLDECG